MTINRSITGTILCSLLLWVGHKVQGQQMDLKVLYQSLEIINGAVTDADGTLFVVYPRMEGGPVSAWAAYARVKLLKLTLALPGTVCMGENDPAKTFVRLNALGLARMGFFGLSIQERRRFCRLSGMAQ